MGLRITGMYVLGQSLVRLHWSRAVFFFHDADVSAIRLFQSIGETQGLTRWLSRVTNHSGWLVTKFHSGKAGKRKRPCLARASNGSQYHFLFTRRRLPLYTHSSSLSLSRSLSMAPNHSLQSAPSLFTLLLHDPRDSRELDFCPFRVSLSTFIAASSCIVFCFCFNSTPL